MYTVFCTGFGAELQYVGRCVHDDFWLGTGRLAEGRDWVWLLDYSAAMW